MSTMALSPVAATRRPGSLRLTRRGRLVVFVASLLLVLLVGVVLGASSVATQDRGEAAPTQVVQVAPGETLWEIASRLTATGGDVRDVMYDIRRLNALESSGLTAGQSLRVPTSG